VRAICPIDEEHGGFGPLFNDLAEHLVERHAVKNVSQFYGTNQKKYIRWFRLVGDDPFGGFSGSPLRFVDEDN